MAFNVIAKANVDSIVTILAAKCLQDLMNSCIMPQVVSVRTDLEGKAREKGDTVRVLIPASLTVHDKAENDEFAFDTASDDNVEIELDTHHEASFRVSSPAKMCSRSDIVERYAKQAALALAAQIDTDLLGLYTGASSSVGTYGTALAKAAMLELRKKFSDAQVGKSDRHVVLSTQGINDLLDEDEFTKAENIGTSEAYREGIVGRIYGMNVWEDPRVPVSDLTTDQHHGLAFQRGCIVYATAEMEIPGPETGVLAAMAAVTDEEGKPTGVQLRNMLHYDAKEDSWLFSADLIYGVKVIRSAGVFEVKR